MRTCASLLCLTLAATFVAAEGDTAPLTDAQTKSIQNLVRGMQAEQTRLKEALTKAQEELAECFAVYELDEKRVAELYKKITSRQEEMLQEHHAMQKVLRTIVGPNQFKNLSRRIENVLKSAPASPRETPAKEIAAQETPPKETPPKETPAKEPPKETAAAPAADKVFSGPQVGEKLHPFKLRGVFDADAGKELDFVTQANGAPIVLIFVHDLNRMSIGFTRTLSQYAAGRAKDGLKTGVVWLDDDATEAEASLKRVRHALAKDAPIGISVDGREGPGSYGLNRKVMLTVLVGKEGKVTANYALVQPSMQVDLPKVLESIVAVAGGKVPKLEELEYIAGMAGMAARGQPARPNTRPNEPEKPDMRPLMAPVIQLKATPEEVETAAKAVEAAAEKDEAVRKEVARISTTIVNSGKLGNYGTAKAQEYLKKWAEKYGGNKPEEKKEEKKEQTR